MQRIYLNVDTNKAFVWTIPSEIVNTYLKIILCVEYSKVDGRCHLLIFITFSIINFCMILYILLYCLKINVSD